MEAELTLSSGERLTGCFFLAGSTATHPGPERVVDLLNSETGFFPFQAPPTAETILVNRRHLVLARLIGGPEEARQDSGYDVATVRRVSVKLTNRVELRGTVRVYLPAGRDRLSDYARSPEQFRYLESVDGTFVVNTDHVVQLSDLPETGN